MDISLVMILKNEAATIERAIKSVLPIVDEVIIGIDRLTEDTTEKIVRNLLEEKSDQGWKISKFDFKDDFSQIRNQYIAKSICSHVLILDGHEYIDQFSLKYIQQLKKMDQPPDVVDVNVTMQDGDGLIIFQQPRIFKKTIRYHYPIHNAILHDENRVTMPQITIVHDQPVSRLRMRQEQRDQINIAGLQKFADEGDARAMYYTAIQHYESKRWNDAIGWFKKYIKLSAFDAERYQARLYLATCYSNQQQYSQAEQCLYDCFKDEVVRNEHLIALGDICFRKDKYHLALSYYRQAASFKMPYKFLIIESKHYTWWPWYKIVHCGLALDDHEIVFGAINHAKVIAPEITWFFDMEELVREKIKQTTVGKSGSILFVASSTTFLVDIIDAVSKQYHIRLVDKFDIESAKFANVIWCEWGDSNAIAISNYQGSAKKILRVHAYEVYSPLIKMINWSGFDMVIFVADHIRKHLAKSLGYSMIPENWMVVPNGIDIHKFDIAMDKKFNTNIAYAGYISNKKGAILLLQTASHLRSFGYKIFVAGEFQEDDVRQLFLAHRPDNLFLCGWQTNLNNFFSDKTYILNTSPRESQCVSVMQGMSAGLFPLVYDWIGAEEIYKRTWNDFKGLQELLLDSKHIPAVLNRKLIMDTYSQDIIHLKLVHLIDQMVREDKHGRENSKIAI